MEVAWGMLDVFFDNPMPMVFIKDLMQELRGFSMIKDREDERLMDYYVLLQSHIEEADKAGLLNMLLILANMEEMVRLHPNWEARAWKERQG